MDQWDAMNTLPVADDLASHVCRSIDVWHSRHPDLTAYEILSALEDIRFKLTEALIRRSY
jgi:hypothetical protein